MSKLNPVKAYQDVQHALPHMAEVDPEATPICFVESWGVVTLIYPNEAIADKAEKRLKPLGFKRTHFDNAYIAFQKG